MDVEVDEIGVGRGQGSPMGISRLGVGKNEYGKGGGQTLLRSGHRGLRHKNALQKIGVDGGRGGWLLVTLSTDHFLPFIMPIEIKMRKNEPIDRALRRMKKKLERENIIKDVRMKRYNEKPCERRRRKEKVMAFTAMLRRKYAE